jgi:putative IMPACT (imprinted ancient) family translation regulator
VTVVVSYSAVTPLQRLLPVFESEVLSQDFDRDATFCLRLPTEQVVPFSAAVVEMTGGQALIETTNSETLKRT